MFSIITRTLASNLVNVFLLSVASALAATVAFLVAIKIADVFRDTRGMQTVTCAIGLIREDCPQYGIELQKRDDQLAAAAQTLDDLEARGAELARKNTAAEKHLESLRAADSAVDEYTLFSTATDPATSTKVTIGTIYKSLVDAVDLEPQYFCYFSLGPGSAGEDRNLHFRNAGGFVQVRMETLREVGLSPEALAFGRSVCKPMLIAKAR